MTQCSPAISQRQNSGRGCDHNSHFVRNWISDPSCCNVHIWCIVVHSGSVVLLMLSKWPSSLNVASYIIWVWTFGLKLDWCVDTTPRWCFWFFLRNHCMWRGGRTACARRCTRVLIFSIQRYLPACTTVWMLLQWNDSVCKMRSDFHGHFSNLHLKDAENVTFSAVYPQCIACSFRLRRTH